MEFDEDMKPLVLQAFQSKIWVLINFLADGYLINPSFDIGLFVQELSAANQNITTWLIDMQVCDEGIVLLTAAYSDEISERFALGELKLCTIYRTFHD